MDERGNGCCNGSDSACASTPGGPVNTTLTAGRAPVEVPVGAAGCGADPRRAVLDAADRFFDARPARAFVPGQTYVPVTGKVLDAADLRQLIEASLDLWLTTGRFSDAFEERLARRFGTKHARATVSGSAANLLAFASLTSRTLTGKDDRGPITPGSEVITVAAGFPTTVAPIVQCGCVPVFVDVDLSTHNATPAAVEAAITPKTRAIMMAHTLGNPFDAAALARIAEKHGLYLVEDCCDAFGATLGGKPVGTFGDVATLSFYPAHHITTGEGGAVMTDSGVLRRAIESLRDWGRDCWCPPGKDNTCGKRFDWQLGELPAGYDHKYIYSHLGYNLKMTDMQCAIGLSQLDKLDGFIARRRENFALLTAGLKAMGAEEHLHLPTALPGAEPSWFGLPLTIRDGSPLQRREVVRELEARKIGTRLLFAGNLVRQPAFQGVQYRVSGTLANTDKTMNDTFWIGVWPGIGPAEREYMLSVMQDILSRAGVSGGTR